MAKLSLEERIQRMEDVHEIQNLMSRYEYWHTAGGDYHDKTAELFAKKAPDVSVEISHWGVWEGIESVKREMMGVHKYSEGDRIGKIFMHSLTTPVIEVARDGKTAKGVWLSPGNETGVDKETGKLQAYWAWGKYGVDFIKEDGKWKMWHFHFYGIFHPAYEKSWVELAEPKDVVDISGSLPPELRPDKPTTYDHPYSTTTAPDLVPAPPEPYDTWKDLK